VPNHVAVILDGNRRYSKGKNLSLAEGYAAGAEKMEVFMEWCAQSGVKMVSAYVLSSDNLKRSKKELHSLFDVMCKYGERWLEPGGLIDKYEVKINFSGNLNLLPLRLLRIIERMKKKTEGYTKRILNILIAYSGKEEIAEAVKGILKSVMKRGIRITPKAIEKNLSVRAPVDLVIRTGGQSRLSNFLIWQTAYAEIYTTKTYWPNLSKREFNKALDFFAGTKRNFGL
jgi:undecaprenyl diphosphate synthase